MRTGVLPYPLSRLPSELILAIFAKLCKDASISIVWARQVFAVHRMTEDDDYQALCASVTWHRESFRRVCRVFYALVEHFEAEQRVLAVLPTWTSERWATGIIAQDCPRNQFSVFSAAVTNCTQLKAHALRTGILELRALTQFYFTVAKGASGNDHEEVGVDLRNCVQSVLRTCRDTLESVVITAPIVNVMEDIRAVVNLRYLKLGINDAFHIAKYSAENIAGVWSRLEVLVIVVDRDVYLQAALIDTFCGDVFPILTSFVFKGIGWNGHIGRLLHKMPQLKKIAGLSTRVDSSIQASTVASFEEVSLQLHSFGTGIRLPLPSLKTLGFYFVCRADRSKEENGSDMARRLERIGTQLAKVELCPALQRVVLHFIKKHDLSDTSGWGAVNEGFDDLSRRLSERGVTLVTDDGFALRQLEGQSGRSNSNDQLASMSLV